MDGIRKSEEIVFGIITGVTRPLGVVTGSVMAMRGWGKVLAYADHGCEERQERDAHMYKLVTGMMGEFKAHRDHHGCPLRV